VCEAVDSIHVAQDEVEWWALVNMVINSDVFTATSIKMTVFWDVAPSSMVDIGP
jgi:hypothetical protein